MSAIEVKTYGRVGHAGVPPASGSASAGTKAGNPAAQQASAPRPPQANPSVSPSLAGSPLTNARPPPDARSAAQNVEEHLGAIAEEAGKQLSAAADDAAAGVTRVLDNAEDAARSAADQVVPPGPSGPPQTFAGPSGRDVSLKNTSKKCNACVTFICDQVLHSHRSVV